MTQARKPKGQANAAIVLADRYRLEEKVAVGGMGEVWRTSDLLLERTVAVKLLRESLAEDPIVAERFRREALTAAGLSHPNMANVYDYVQDEGRPGIVMEFVQGETLAERIERDGPLTEVDAVRTASALLAALSVAHEAGIVHRDVKPGNVMLTPTGEVKVTDFGIARAAGHETLTETGMVVGTAHYLSPEQVSGKPASPSSDLYAVGAILYEMLTGHKPFEAETPLAVAMQRLTEDPIALQERRPGIPEPIAQVALRALARDPEHRYASADGMRSALEAALSSTQSATQPHRMDPTPTMVLPAIDDPHAPTIALRAQTATPPAAAGSPLTPITGSSPAAAVSKRRLGDYRRGLLWAVLLAVAVSGIALLVLASRDPGPVTVPDFTGRNITQAKALADELGLNVVEKPQASAKPEGDVLSQSIPADVHVASGVTVTLVTSNGVPPCCKVPNLDGLSQSQAAAKLKDAGLVLGDVGSLTTSDDDPGTVISQTPGAGVTKPPGTEVDIVIAKEPEGRGKGKGKGNGN
ncbi:MAG: Stk1 family PASTA domain-containing Ser/Thr kinase [Actinomycetota bacterium]